MQSLTRKSTIFGDLPSTEDLDFLMREEMRSHRIALEFERAELGLIDRGIESTIVVFGSSRMSDKPSQPAQNKHLRRNANTTHFKPRKCYQMAHDFGRIVSELGGALSPKNGKHENVITTGGGPGIMEAANRGAAEAGAPTIGLNIDLPCKQEPNKYITPGLSFHFRYFAVRKMHFAMRANALVVFPGGFGTLDELFEILTLKQTRKAGGMPVILFCRSYWERLIDFNALLEYGMVEPQDLELFKIVDSAKEGWEAILELGLAAPTPLKER